MKIVGTLGVIKALTNAELVKENPESICERLIEQSCMSKIMIKNINADE